MEAQLAKEIKSFRKQFHKQYGRDPSSKDMAKVPEVKATYDAWIALKSNHTASGSDVAATTTKKKKSMSIKTMPPPLLSGPTTPKKKMSKKVQRLEEQRTPVRQRGDGSQSIDVNMESAVHDSGGSVVDVPTTPMLQQGRNVYRSALSPASPSVNFSTMTTTAGHSPRRRADFDDGTSPSKLKSLIASFATTRSNMTPTKHSKRDDEDVRLAKRLDAARGGGANGRRVQNGDLFTPRTKARKRLRGEIVVTPAKERQVRDSSLNNNDDDGSAKRKTTPSKAIRPSKRQRGMGTLRAFNFLPSTGNGQTSNPTHATSFSLTQSSADGGVNLHNEDDEDEDDDMIGPSPSARKIVDMSLASFRPLFSAQTVDGLDDEQDTEDETPLPSSQGVENDASDTALTTPAPLEEEENVDSDEEERRLTRAYQRHDTFIGRTSDEEDEVDGLPYGGAVVLRSALLQCGEQEGRDASLAAGDQDGDEEVAFGALSITSPQCKRADRARRQMQARSLHRLLERPNDTAGLFDDDDDDEDEGSGEHVQNKAEAKGKTTIAHGNAKTARMMRGALTKAARKAMILAEAKEEKEPTNESSAEEKGGEKANDSSNSDATLAARKRLILRRGREGDDEELTEQDPSTEDARSIADDDEWASDVGSDEYGLGDGYMDGADVE